MRKTSFFQRPVTVLKRITMKMSKRFQYIVQSFPIFFLLFFDEKRLARLDFSDNEVQNVAFASI